MYLLVTSNNTVSKLPINNKPLTFAHTADLSSLPEVSLKQKQNKTLIYGTIRTSYISPLYPGTVINDLEVKATYCTSMTGEERTLYYDKKWKVYWIITRQCNQTAIQSYGPFRTTLPIESIFDIEKYDTPTWHPELIQKMKKDSER